MASRFIVNGFAFDALTVMIVITNYCGRNEKLLVFKQDFLSWLFSQKNYYMSSLYVITYDMNTSSFLKNYKQIMCRIALISYYKCCRESRAVDMESLCVIAGKLVWAIRIDLQIVDNGG